MSDHAIDGAGLESQTHAIDKEFSGVLPRTASFGGPAEGRRQGFVESLINATSDNICREYALTDGPVVQAYQTAIRTKGKSAF